MKQFGYVLTQEQTFRPKNELLKEASRFKSRVYLTQGEKQVELTGKEAAQLTMRCGSRVMVTVEGKDEEAAVAAIQNYFVANM